MVGIVPVGSAIRKYEPDTRNHKPEARNPSDRLCFSLKWTDLNHKHSMSSQEKTKNVVVEATVITPIGAVGAVC